jgi:hypothetical protein
MSIREKENDQILGHKDDLCVEEEVHATFVGRATTDHRHGLIMQV